MRPFPYREREVVVPHPGGHVLAGTLTLPGEKEFGPGPYVAVALKTGGGQEDRDSSALGHKTFLVLSDALTRRRVAVMRYDDRGVGGSTVDEQTPVGKDATSLDLSTDAVAVVRHLATIEEIDAARIGLIGHSEGGLIAPLACRDEPLVAFVVMLAGPCVSGATVFHAQLRAAWIRGVGDSPELDALCDLFAGYQRRLGDGGSSDALAMDRAALAELAVDAGLFADAPDPEKLAAAEADFEMFDAPWWRFMFGYRPAETLARVGQPILALNGTLDVQVDAEANLTALEELARSSDLDVTTRRLEGMNHLFQPATTGAPEEYAEIEITMDPSVLALIADWIDERIAAR